MHLIVQLDYWASIILFAKVGHGWLEFKDGKEMLMPILAQFMYTKTTSTK
jgi:hypothetical protein